jgi:hypothetical protein
MVLVIMALKSITGKAFLATLPMSEVGIPPEDSEELMQYWNMADCKVELESNSRYLFRKREGPQSEELQRPYFQLCQYISAVSANTPCEIHVRPPVSLWLLFTIRTNMVSDESFAGLPDGQRPACISQQEERQEHPKMTNL